MKVQISTEYKKFQILLLYILYNDMLGCFPVSTSTKKTLIMLSVGSLRKLIMKSMKRRKSYGYEYLQDIAGYAGWTYKYITSDWKTALHS